MAYRINHIHLKAPDPRKTAEWYVRAFAFKILSDEVRVFGDRFVRCQSEDGGMLVNISGARTGEALGPGDARAHHGLEHFGFDSESLEADIARLEGFGARLLEGPIQNPRPNLPATANFSFADLQKRELSGNRHQRRRSGSRDPGSGAQTYGAGPYQRDR